MISRADPIQILLLERDPDDRHRVRKALGEHSGEFAVTEVAPGQGFERELSTGRYDCVLTDPDGAGADGSDVPDRVKTLSPRTAIVILAHPGSEKAALKWLKQGAADYLIKNSPEIEKLPYSIRAAVDRVRAREERQRAEQRIERLAHLYDALSQTNQAILRCKDRGELFREVCRIAVEHGGLRMAWIGWLDPDTRNVMPVASFGQGQNFLEQVPFFADPQRPEMHGLVGAALQAAQPYVSNDLGADPVIAMIHEAAARAGFRSGASFPLWLAGHVVGGLTLFAGEVGFFDERLVQLLAEMAADISFALDNFEKEARRRHAEDRLRKLSHAVEQSPAVVVITDTDGHIEYVNPVFTGITGYAAEEVIGRTPAVVKSGLTPMAVYQDLWRTIKSGGEWRGEMQNRKKNGELYWEYEIISPVKNERGEIVNFIAVKEDITGRKRAESELIRMNRTLRMISECNQVLVMAKSEPELLEAICQIIVKMGGYPHVWVGYAEQTEAKRVAPVATACAPGWNLDAMIENVTWGEAPTARGTGGTAIKTGQVFVSRDLLTNARYAPWHAVLAGYGISAAISLPLKSEGRAFGVLTIYAREDDAFNADEAKLLQEMGEDLAYGITSLRGAEKRRKAEESLRDLLIEQESILENTIVGIAFLKERRIMRCNRGFAAMFGYQPDELIGMSTRPLHVSDEAFEARGQESYRWVEKGGYFTADMQLRRKDGSLFWANRNLTAVDRNDLSKGVIWVVQDISERKRAEDALRLRDRAIESSLDGIMISDSTLPDKPVIYVNPAFERITGYTATEAVGRNGRFLVRQDKEQIGLAEVRMALREGRPAATVIRSYRKDGSLFWNELSLAPVRNEAGEVTHFVSIINDVTERMRYEAELEHQANHDALTGLANRNLLADRLEQAVANAQRYERVMAVVFLDLDHFKVINDSLNHQAGDALVKQVGKRLSGCVREVDTVARVGGDEFVLVFSDAGPEEQVSLTLQRLQEAMTASFNVDGQELYVTCSMGASLYPKDGRDGPTLLKNADAAMYRAKEGGRHTFRFYTPEMNAKVGERLSLQRGLRRALENAEFVLHYQPQVNLASGAIVGAEALVRWQHPELGLVGPGRFIRVAEETGLIIPIGEWVLDTACAQNAAWQSEGLPRIVVGVNLSARQFSQKNLTERVAQALRRHALQPGWLDLELTESMVMHNAEEAIATLQELSALGTRISLDDFGTGYSSLNYLKRFPINKLKIDQSFVRDLARDPDDAAIVKAVIAMAHSLNLTVIAEGVETREQLVYLRRHQCDEMQGYDFSKPVTAYAFAELLRAEKKLS